MNLIIRQILNFETLLIWVIKCVLKPHSFLVIDDTLASDDPLRFRDNPLEIIQKLIMTTDDKIRDDTSREAAKVLTSPSEKIDKYEYLTDEEI